MHLSYIDNFMAIWKSIDHLTIQHKLDDKVINPDKGKKKDNKIVVQRDISRTQCLDMAKQYSVM